MTPKKRKANVKKRAGRFLRGWCTAQRIRINDCQWQSGFFCDFLVRRQESHAPGRVPPKCAIRLSERETDGPYVF